MAVHDDARHRWEAQVAQARLRDCDFETVSGAPTPLLATPDDLPPDWPEQVGYPGEYPFTRGPYPTMYRGRLWTMRQFAGFGSAAATNGRFRLLLQQGQTGLSTAFDMPTLMGYDADHELAHGEVGKCGVAISSLQDMERLFADIPLDEVSTSMTINGPAPVIWAMLIAAAEKRGISRARLKGTTQNDILKEYIAQKEYLFPPRASLRLVTDTVEFAARELPGWHPISISGYHIREAGSTAVQELAFTLADGFAYVEAAIARGLDVDEFAPQLSFFFNAHSDFFEEIAKLRAARRLFARRMRERYGARKPESWRLKTHCQTAGCSLTAQQPLNNIVRTAIQALAGVLGGTQSLHTNSMDETLALPSERAVIVALRTQQIIAHETGVANVVDPLGGSWYVESLTNRMEEEALALITQIEELGGVVAAIEQGFQMREIGRAAMRYQRDLEAGRKVMVGVNRFVEPAEDVPIPLLEIGEEVEREQVQRLVELRRTRDTAAVARSLARLRQDAANETNVMPALIEAVSSYATLGEIVAALREVYGDYQEPAIF